MFSKWHVFFAHAITLDELNEFTNVGYSIFGKRSLMYHNSRYQQNRVTKILSIQFGGKVNLMFEMNTDCQRR